MADRRILIIAGPNGAGKTTFATDSNASTGDSSTNGWSTTIRETHRSCWRRRVGDEFTEREYDANTA